eukprot:gene18573-22225_t
MNEEKSLSNFKLKLARLLTKDEIKKYGKNTEGLAKYCHSKNVYYPITVFEQETPICFMENRTKSFAVRFLDERLFWYVAMNYSKYNDGKMFLDEIWIREYMHKETEELRDLKSDQHYQFTIQGDLKITTETIIRDGETQISREVKQASEPVNVSQNWQKIPEFGDYYGLINYKEIIKPVALMKAIK